MRDDALFALPASLPPGVMLVGPPGWVADGVPLLTSVSDLVELLPAGDPAEQTDAAVLVPCAILHGDHLRAGEDEGALAASLESLQRARPGTLTLLLYDRLSLAALAELFEAGLTAALGVPIEPERWAGASARIAERREQRARMTTLRRQGEETAHRLRAHRRQLQEEVSRVGEELIGSQRRLELANRELTDHMSQLALLYRFGRELSGARNWDATLASILENLAGFVGARGAALVLRAAPGAPYTPRQTFAWEESAWDRILVRIEEQIGRTVAERVISPGVFRLDAASELDGAGRQRGITALPLEHQGVRLGYLLLLDCEHGVTEAPSRHLPFLQAVQVILAEEVAGAQMLDRIRELGAFNARVLDTVRSGIWVIDERARTIYCNRQGRRLLTGREETPVPPPNSDAGIGRGRTELGTAEARLDPLRLWLPIGPELPELFLDGLLRLGEDEGPPFARLFGLGDESYLGEGRIVRAGGESIPVLIQTSLMPGRGQDERWLVLVAEDLREAKKLEAERSRADSLEGMVEMSAALAHEIRNPLMGLSAQAELLAEQLPPGDSRRRYLDVITGEVERINGTINRLLNFVRPYEAQLAPSDMAAIARDCLLLLEPEAAERDIRLGLRLEPGDAPPSTWALEVDADQLKQVLINLLLNALDASPSGGAVTLSLRGERRLELPDVRRGSGQIAAGMVVEVSDEGAGFPARDAERLFRPFYTTKSSGTGLGLSICRKIIAAHGGEIRARREEGTTVFRVVLPDTAARERQQEES